MPSFARLETGTTRFDQRFSAQPAGTGGPQTNAAQAEQSR